MKAPTKRQAWAVAATVVVAAALVAWWATDRKKGTLNGTGERLKLDFSKINRLFLLNYWISFRDVSDVFHSGNSVTFDRGDKREAIVGLSSKNMLLTIDYEVSKKAKYDIQINDVIYADNEEKAIWCYG